MDVHPQQKYGDGEVAAYLGESSASFLEKAATMNVTATQIEDALYTAYSSRQISTIYAPNKTYLMD